jgi:cytochrome b subunit of formate dehydrogenase
MNSLKRNSARVVLLLLTVNLLFSSHVLTAEDSEGAELSNEACFECHSDKSLTKETGGKEVSLFVDAEKYSRSVHGGNECISCHTDVTEIPHSESLKKVDCGQCHGEESTTYLNSTHGKGFIQKIPDAPDCATCHGKHDILPKSDPASKTHPLHQIQICTTCHVNPRIAGKYSLPTADKIEAYRTGVHGRGVIESGLLVSANCVTCHTAHNVRPKTDPKSTIYWSKIPDLCGTCHLGILEDFRQSEHGKLWIQKSSKGPGCITCHGAHGILHPVSLEFQLQIPALCGNCHRIQGRSYKDNFHGQVTALGFVQAASCADCHTAHKNLRKEDVHSTVHPANLQKTCGSCHGKVSAAYITYDPHMNPSDPNRNRIIYYIRTFFIVMIYFVFGFFGLHYLLWFIRSMIGFLRGEFKSHPDTRGPHIRRFAPAHVWVHTIVALTFTVLSITGFTIYFHDAAAARFTAKILGGIGFMRYLHRVAALLTFGYAFFHIAYLAYLYFRKKEKGLLRGPAAMTPSLKDFGDFFRNMRWFLFLGPLPKFDRWTYWEKLEYLVEWWGVPVIGISGLALWFPKFFTAFLPGWVLNAAQVIHTYEAFLAAGYVFLFHFFIAHLRPETFPMDASIFTGRVSLERFKEERPLEYERLVSSGELQKSLEDPPTKSLLRASFAFGLIIVLAGLLVMIGILRSVLTG